jgi:DNA-binding IclR family transcriptional regulator
MGKQLVRHTEQNDVFEEVATAPAPMVERAFQLLELLSNSEEGMTLSELARALHSSRGSTHGLLKVLESNGVVEQEEERRFVLGPHIYDLAQGYVQRAGLRHYALPTMRRLAKSSGETVCLGKIEPKGVRIIESIVDEEDQSALHISARRGMRVPLLAAAIAPFVLTSWPMAQRAEFLHTQELPHFTQRSITDPRQFLKRVEEAAYTGIAFDYGEYLEGVNALAAPIYGSGNTLVALLWIVGFSSRWNKDAIECAVPQLREETIAISSRLGARV